MKLLSHNIKRSTKFSRAQKRTVYEGKPPPEQKPIRLASSYLSGGATALGIIGIGIWFVEKEVKQLFLTSTLATIESCSQISDKTYNVTYSFLLNGEKFDGMQKTKKPYTQGSTVTLYYDQKDPYKSYLERGSSLELAVGIFVLILGLYTLKKVIR
jgi:hypothetical protein